MIDVDGTEWVKAMRRGDFAAAWNISDAQLRTRGTQDHQKLPRHFQNVWDGSSVLGQRVLVRCYHGLGDTIQFIRYVQLLKEVAAAVIVWVQPSLIPLLRTVKGVDQLLPLHEGVPDVDYDVDVELGELPHVFRTTITSIPAEAPYIFVEPAVLRGDGRFRVGLIWESGDWNTHRSVPFSEIQRLGQLPALTGTSCSGIPGKQVGMGSWVRSPVVIIRWTM